MMYGRVDSYALISAWGYLKTGALYRYVAKYSLSQYYTNSVNTAGEETTTIGTSYTGAYHIWEVQRLATSNKYIIDNSEVDTDTTRYGSETSPCILQAYSNGASILFDWVAVRKIAATEPTCTLTEAPEGDPPVASFTTSKTFVRIPQSITFTDTSTETPDEWLWDFGDGTTSTDQNPVHKYTKRGKWNVTLNATNDAGSDESDVTTVRVTGYETYT